MTPQAARSGGTAAIHRLADESNWQQIGSEPAEDENNPRIRPGAFIVPDSLSIGGRYWI